MYRSLKKDPQLVPVIRCLARLWAAALFLFWGAFFVEHTADWFLHLRKLPPMDVGLLHFAHFALLLGLAAGWRWELLGGVTTLAAAMVFFPQVSGKNAVIFLLVSIVPAVVWIGLGGYSIGSRLLASSGSAG